MNERTLAESVAMTLSTVCDAESPNAITVEQLRTWMLEYLAEYDEELAKFPEIRGEPHWNLWMNDSVPDDAVFVVVSFEQDRLRLSAGLGYSYDVISFVEQGGPWNASEASSAIGSEFHLSIPVEFAKSDAENWLGRRW